MHELLDVCQMYVSVIRDELEIIHSPNYVIINSNCVIIYCICLIKMGCQLQGCLEMICARMGS